jgi:hypothetical protein
VKVVAEDPGRVIGEITALYKANRFEYQERYSAAVMKMCGKYGQSVGMMNEAIADNPVLAKEVYSTMDRDFNKDMKALRRRLEHS